VTAQWPDDISWAALIQEAMKRSTGIRLSQTEASDLEEHVAVLMNATAIAVERGKRYGDLWRHRGYLGNLLHMDSKHLRLMREFYENDSEIQQNQLDDAYDLINYTVFFIRNVEDGNERGNGPVQEGRTLM
jgi:hypothetical protein